MSAPGVAHPSMAAAGAPSGQPRRRETTPSCNAGRALSAHSSSAPDLHVPAPDLRRAVGVSNVVPRWVSAGGAAGYHFPAPPDDHEHGLQEARHEASEQRKWQQSRRLQAEQRSVNIIDHDSKVRKLTHFEACLRPYDVNGRVVCAGKDRTVPLEQPNKTHWLCQVSGSTSRYNIISNVTADPHVMRHRDDEVFRASSTGRGFFLAGDVQPQRDVTSYDIPGFARSKQRILPGAAERNLTLFST